MRRVSSKRFDSPLSARIAHAHDWLRRMMATQQEALLQAIGPDSDHGYGDAGMILTTGLAVLLFVATIWVYSLQH